MNSCKLILVKYLLGDMAGIPVHLRALVAREVKGGVVC